MRDQQTICEEAVQGMFLAITTYGVRDEAIVRQWAGRYLSSEEAHWVEADDRLEFECFQQAVDEAELFYQDEAGGSHDLSHLAGCDVWQTLASLPN